MSFDHKAFEFEWTAFSEEMLPWLSKALAHDHRDRLLEFVDANSTVCRSPYDGEPLSDSWREMLETGDAQELADFALTKYYDPADDHGLGDAWLDLDEKLEADMKEALLGKAIPRFDPGRQGAYFVSPSAAANYAKQIDPLPDPLLRSYASFLRSVSSRGRGAYVTF